MKEVTRLYKRQYANSDVAFFHTLIRSFSSPTFILPINLPMLSSQAGYLVFVVPEDIAEDVCKDLTFQIRTNRCKEVQKKFSLNELVTIHHTLHKK